MNNINRAIKKINPNAEFCIGGNSLDNITWLNGTTPISKSDIETKMAELPTEEEEAAQRENEKAFKQVFSMIFHLLNDTKLYRLINF